MTKTLLLGAAVFLFAACNQSQNSTGTESAKTESAPVNIDSLDKAFDEAWNKDDSATVVNAFAEDVVLLNGRNKLSGKQELANKWISAQLPVTSNLKTDLIQKASGTEIAYTAGTWSLDVTLPGKSPMAATGNYTFIYKKQSDGSWKISLINVEDHDPEPAPNNSSK